MTDVDAIREWNALVQRRSTGGYGDTEFTNLGNALAGELEKCRERLKRVEALADELESETFPPASDEACKRCGGFAGHHCRICGHLCPTASEEGGE